MATRPGDIFICNKQGLHQLEKFCARKPEGFFGKGNQATFLEDGSLVWLSQSDTAAPPLKDVKEAAFSATYTCILDKQGRVYRLHGNQVGAIDRFGMDTKVSHIGSGPHHFVAILEGSGHLYVWSQAAHGGQLGLGLRPTSDEEIPLSDFAVQPKVVPALLKQPVQHVACGEAFTAAIVQSGELWTWGEGTCGQLGYGHLLSKQSIPRLAAAACPESGCGFDQVACGFAHMMVVTSDRQRMYSCGLNSHGQLGIDNQRMCRASLERIYFPTTRTSMNNSNLAQMPASPLIRDIQASRFSSAALHIDGKLFIWGACQAYVGLFNMDSASHARAQLRQYSPRQATRFDGQIISHFALNDAAIYLFSPAQVKALSRAYDPIQGGSQLDIFGIGFSDTGTIVVRFELLTRSDSNNEDKISPKAALGSLIVVRKPDGSEARAIRTITPSFARGGPVAVEVALDGRNFTSNGVLYQVYAPTFFTHLSPTCSHIDDSPTLRIEGEGFFDSPTIVARFSIPPCTRHKSADRTIEVATAAQESEEGQLSLMETQEQEPAMLEDVSVIMPVHYVEESTENTRLSYIELQAPTFPDCAALAPFQARIEIAMDAEHFEVLPQKLKYHAMSLSSLKPAALPSASGGLMNIHGSGFLREVGACIQLMNIENGPQTLHLETVRISDCHLQCPQTPPPSSLIGRDVSTQDFVQVMLTLTADGQIVSQQLPLYYYADFPLVCSHTIVAQGTVIIFTREDGAAFPVLPCSAQATFQGQGTSRVDAIPTNVANQTYTALQITCPAPFETSASPGILNAKIPVPVHVSISLNGHAPGSSTFELMYADPPQLKELTPNEAPPGDKLILKGTGFLASAHLMVQFKYNGSDGEEFMHAPALYVDSHTITCNVPVPPQPLPVAIIAISVALDGQTYSPVKIEGVKSPIRLNIADKSSKVDERKAMAVSKRH